MTEKTDMDRLHDDVERDSTCRDDNERGYWRKRLRDLEQGKNENPSDN
jgi:hypothetical protein